jgi:hypothetical protein
MATETFTYSTQTLTFSTAGHLLSDGETLVPNQESDVTIGGVRLTANLGDARHQWQVTVIVPESSASATDLTDILGFLGSTGVNYGVEAFTWSDYSGTTRSVTIINDSIGIESLGAGWKKVSFSLEEVNT